MLKIHNIQMTQKKSNIKVAGAVSFLSLTIHQYFSAKKLTSWRQHLVENLLKHVRVYLLN